MEKTCYKCGSDLVEHKGISGKKYCSDCWYAIGNWVNIDSSTILDMIYNTANGEQKFIELASEVLDSVIEFDLASHEYVMRKRKFVDS